MTRSGLLDAYDTRAPISRIVSCPRIFTVRDGIQIHEDGFPTEQFTKPHVGTDEFIS
jgi:hypothetical protein